MSNSPVLSQWDEGSITAQLRQLRDQKPGMIPHYVESVKERFIIKQDDRTAQARLRFMQSQIEQLKLAKDFQQLRDDLEILAYERQKRIKTLEVETQELDLRKEQISTKQKLETLREQKKLELEIAQIEVQINQLKNQTPAEPKLTSEQQRAKERAAIEEKIQGLKDQKQAAMRLADEDERNHRVNAIDGALQREYERWSKFL